MTGREVADGVELRPIVERWAVVVDGRERGEVSGSPDAGWSGYQRTHRGAWLCIALRCASREAAAMAVADMARRSGRRRRSIR
jgi:hypothetical protein